MNRPHPISLMKLGGKQVFETAARHELLYSGRAGGARAVFAFHDLSGVDLSGRDLTEADFTGAYLDETDLSESQLDSACFAGASMSRANLAGASLRRANLRGTMLEGANLIGANLSEADMREKHTKSGPHASSFRTFSGDLSPTKLSAALLSSANLEGAKMPGLEAVQADFSLAILKRCD
ncbi:MAG: pentapeptide repeat-containing protein, partial [Alphaproteobacteria bacterium]